MDINFKTTKNFNYDSVYVTGDIVAGVGPFTARPFGNVLHFDGNILAQKNVICYVNVDDIEVGAKDLFFDGHLYVTGEIVGTTISTMYEAR